MYCGTLRPLDARGTKFNFRPPKSFNNQYSIRMFGIGWVLLNVTLLCLAMLCCYIGYTFIFCRIWDEAKRNTIPEHLWGISLGGSDITASTISLPYFIAGLIKQKEFLPKWVCILVGFVDNMYLAASVWTIVMWSIHRLIYLKMPSNTNGLTVARTMIVCVWFGSILLALPPVFFSIPYSYTFSDFSLTCSARNTTYLLLFGSLCIVLPIIVISVVFTQTYRVTNLMELKAKRYRPMKIQSDKEMTATKGSSIKTWMRNHFTSSSSSRNAHLNTSSESLSTAIVRKRQVGSKELMLQAPPRGSPENHQTGTKQKIAKDSRSSADESLEIERIKHNLKSYETVVDLNVTSILAPFLGEEDDDEEAVFAPNTAIKTKTFRFINLPADEGETENLMNNGKKYTVSNGGFVIQPRELKRMKRVLLNSVSSGRSTVKTKFLRGRKRTVLILLCLFCSQIMSTLPIYILFIIFHYGDVDFKPTPKMVTLMTTLLVCNTGFNPMIRIAIRPAYNKQFMTWLFSGLTYLRLKLKT